MKDGLYRMSYARYAQIEAVNWSTLKELQDRSLFAFKYILGKPRETSTALELGTALHTAILEPERFEDSVKIMKSANGLVERSKLKKEFPSHAVISKPEYDQVIAMRDSIQSNESYAKYLTGGQAEVVLLWTCPNTNVRCKARLDYFNSEFICDLKTTAESQSAFADTAFKYGYLSQAAWYVWGYTLLCKKSTNFAFAVVGKEPPYEAYFVRVADEQIEYGFQQARCLLEQYNNALETNEWPRCEPEIEFTLSPWNIKKINELNIKEF